MLRKSLFSRKLRLLLSGTAVVLAVAFMAGALVLNATLSAVDKLPGATAAAAAVTVFFGAFLIRNTFSIIVAERTRELALMRALGGTRRQLVTSVLVEAGVVGFVAALAGVALGIGAGYLAARLLIGAADGTLPVVGLIGCLLVGTAATPVAALAPALRATRGAPIAGIRETADRPKSMIKLGVAGGLLTAAGAGLLLAPANPTQLLIGVLCALLGVALLTPLFAGPVVSGLGRLVNRWVPGDLGRRNSARDPRRTAITAAALMIGVALVTAGSTVTSSLKASVAAAVGDHLTADLAVFGDPEDALTIDPQRMAHIRGIQTVDLVAGRVNERATVNGQPASVETWDDNGAANLLMSRRATHGTVDIVSGQVMLSETAAKDRHLALGDRLTIQLPHGSAGYTVAGIYADTRIDDGIIMAWSDAQKTFSSVLASAAFIKVHSRASVADTQQQVNQVLDDPQLAAQTVQQTIDRLDGVFDRVLNVAQGMLAVAMVIAVLGIADTLVLSVLERTRELGLLRAIGLRRGQVLRMITVESVLISLFGAILGLVVGGLLGAAVTRGLRSQGFDTLAMPWTEMAVYLVAAALVGVLAAIAPAIRAARLDVLAAIAYE